MRIHCLTALSLCFVLFAGAGASRAEKLTEEGTGVEFDAKKTVDGKSYTLIGAGVRKKVFVKVYAMGLYVEDVEGKRAFPSLATKAGGTELAKLTQGDRAQQFVLWGQFSKLAVLHFVRDVAADKLREAFEEGLAEELAAKAPADVRDVTQLFLKQINRDAKTGEELVLRTSPDGRVELSIGGAAVPAVQNAKLARAIWGLWLGGKPISKDLRGALVNRIGALAK